MPDLPKKKVGIVSCSGEEIPEGTVTRLAALKVLEQLHPADTVTICLPLFLAGGEGDRAFARFYPTIAIDGCDKRCAARGTEMYSGKPAASIVVTELVAELGLGKPEGKRRLNKLVCRRLRQQPDKFQGWWMNCCKNTGIARRELLKKPPCQKCRNRSRQPAPAVLVSRCRISSSTGRRSPWLPCRSSSSSSVIPANPPRRL